MRCTSYRLNHLIRRLRRVVNLGVNMRSDLLYGHMVPTRRSARGYGSVRNRSPTSPPALGRRTPRASTDLDRRSYRT